MVDNNTIEAPTSPPVSYHRPVQAFTNISKGWKAKPPISNIELIHKPAFILVMNNAEVMQDGDTPPDQTIYMTDRFILTGMSEERVEKVQIMETFGEAAISFFDMKTRVYQIVGTLIEANGGLYENYYKWASAFKDLYDKHLRGTELVKQKKKAILSVQDSLIHFYPLSLSTSINAGSPYSVSFSMNILVTDHLTTAGAKRSLSKEYTYSTEIDVYLGLAEIYTKLKAAQTAFNERPDSTTFDEFKELSAEKTARQDQYNYLSSAYTALSSKYAKAATDENAPDMRQILLSESQTEKDNAERLYKRKKNEYLSEETVLI